MPRSDKAREIADKLGIRRIKAESLCLNCHFTTQEREGRKDVVAGIACESCHSPAGGWLKRHSEYSGKKRETETPAEASLRWQESEAAGMIRPAMTYRLAKNCYSCHITPNEELVNVGGHSPARKRMLFVVGAMVELEESLRAAGLATAKADYAMTMAKRAKIAAQRMAAIHKALDVPETGEIIAVVSAVKLALNNKDELMAAADKIGTSAQTFASRYDGSTFAAIDAMIPGPDKYRGKPVALQ